MPSNTRRKTTTVHYNSSASNINQTAQSNKVRVFCSPPDHSLFCLSQKEDQREALRSKLRERLAKRLETAQHQAEPQLPAQLNQLETSESEQVLQAENTIMGQESAPT